MPLLEIDDDVYQYLLRKAIRIGEDGSSILRRELKLVDPGIDGNSSPPTNESAQDPRVAVLTVFLSGPRLAAQRNVTDRFLQLLGFLAKQHGEEFPKVLHLRGRNRRYFGRTREEVETSGRTLHPQRIPDTNFWAMTNADTPQKKDIISAVMSILGYPKDSISQARMAIER